MSSYQSGTCNIDSLGIERRKKRSTIVLIAGIIAIILSYVIGLTPGVRYIVAVGFSFGFLLLFFQAKESFCVVAAVGGYYEEGTIRVKITGDKTNDVWKAGRMFVKVLALSLVLGLLGALPF